MSEPRPPLARRPRPRPFPALPLLVALPFVAACALSRPEPELLRRYDRFETADSADLVQVSVFASPLPSPERPPLLSELSKSAQAAYIRSLADRTRTADGLQRALGAPVGGPAAGPRPLDRTRFRRRVVVSVERRSSTRAPEPASGSRLARVRVALGADRAARFTSWDRFVTRYDTVEIGTMELSRSNELGADLELGAGSGTVADPSGSIGIAGRRAVGLDESLPLRERHVSNGILRPDSMVLVQEGAAGVDLVGNSVVEVELRVEDRTAATVSRFEGLYGPDGRPRPGDSVRLATRQLVAARRAEPVTAELRFEALVRTVRPGRGDATYSEGDDHVRYLRTAGGGSAVVLVPGRELRASVWTLVSGACELLEIEHPVAGSSPGHGALWFASRGDAVRFLQWLGDGRRAGAGGARAPITVAGRRLWLGPGAPLSRSGLPALFVQLQPLNWSPGGYSVCP